MKVLLRDMKTQRKTPSSLARAGTQEHRLRAGRWAGRGHDMREPKANVKLQLDSEEVRLGNATGERMFT